MVEKRPPAKRQKTSGPAKRAGAPRGTVERKPGDKIPRKSPKRKPLKKRLKMALGRLIPSRRALVWLGFRLALAGFIVGGLAIVYFARDLPDIRSIDTIRKQQGITIEDANGVTVANYGDVYGEYIPYDQLPKYLIQAVIATEDRRFFEHHGVDIFGIARAAFTNARAGYVVQGGSTVTQQVAKNVFLTSERSLTRKIQEVLLAFWLEGRFSKKEIMAIYLNRVYLGSGAFGVDAAAKRYFNKGARDLTLEESALLAGLLKAPSRYSPAANSDRARDRMHQVLLNMEDAGFLRKPQVTAALEHYANRPATQTNGSDVRYFTDWVIDEIPAMVGNSTEDLVVRTTLNPTLQAQAAEKLKAVLDAQGTAKHISQGAIVAMQANGAVEALVGGVSYAQSQYNRATQAKRQPGSVFKLFVYLAALEAGLTPQSMVEDAPITLQVGNKLWSPDNYSSGGGYKGEIPMVEALRQSLNTVAVRLSQYAGVNRVAQMAERLGLENIPERPSIALGAVEATLLEMTGAYAHMANNGNKVVPYGIAAIHTRKGQELYQHEEIQAEPVLARGTLEMMNYMLLDVVRRGTAVKANLPGRMVAGKTGTSQDFKDAWFIGFTPQMVTGVWVGNDDNKPMKKITGGSVPATIWHDFMLLAMEGVPAKSIPNSPSSSEGLFPWLFGGDSVQQPPADAVNVAPTDIPVDAPFGLANPPRSAPPEHRESAPLPSTDLLIDPLPPAPKEADVLTPQFWNKLMDKAVPEKSKVEDHDPSDEER